MKISKFKKLPIMGIIRGLRLEAVKPIAEAIISSGLETVEITMNTKGAARLIRKMKTAARGYLTIGAGTVLTTKDLHKALDAGATFVVMPTLVREIVEYCVKNKIPVFPGAFTPQEIYTAWRAGATMVKVFPAKFFGPPYFKEVKGPFSDIKLLACGGVRPDNIKSFFLSGASAVAFGGSIFREEWIKARNFSKVAECIKELLEAYKTKGVI